MNHCLKIFLILVRTRAGFKMYVLSSLYVSSLHSHQFSSESAIWRVSQPVPSLHTTHPLPLPRHGASHD